MGWVGGLTVIIMQVSVQIGLNWYWTGTELGNRGYKKSTWVGGLKCPKKDCVNFIKSMIHTIHV